MGAQIAFGLFPVFGPVLFAPGAFTPLGLGAWRLVAGALILGTSAALIYRGRALLHRSDIGRFTIAAWLGVAWNQGLYLEGLARSTPLNAALVACLIPVFTYALATLVRHETFSVTRAAGILIALAGSLPLFGGAFSGLGRYGVGNLLMVGNSLSYSTYLIVSRPLVRRYPPLVVVAWAYLLSLPFAPLFAWHQTLVPGAGHAAAWWGLAFALAFPTVLAYVFNMFALSRVPASTTAIYIYSQPLTTGLTSWAVYGETPTPPMLLAAGALFRGIWLVSRRS